MQKLQIGQAEVAVLARILRKVDFFSPLTVGQMEQVLPYILLQAYKPGETVFRQGEPGDAFYIVHTGKVEVWIKKGFFSLSKLVAALGPGDFFGEMSLLSRDKRNATVKCAEQTQLFVLVAGDFEFVLKSNPQTAAEMQRIAARRKYGAAHQSDK